MDDGICSPPMQRTGVSPKASFRAPFRMGTRDAYVMTAAIAKVKTGDVCACSIMGTPVCTSFQAPTTKPICREQIGCKVDLRAEDPQTHCAARMSQYLVMRARRSAHPQQDYEKAYCRSSNGLDRCGASCLGVQQCKHELSHHKLQAMTTGTGNAG